MVTFFVPYPPNGDEDLPPRIEASGPIRERSPIWNPCSFGIEPEYSYAVRSMETCEHNFIETSNPLYALEAFRLATSAKLYPPLWVLEFLGARFNHAFSENVSLDRAFGFSRDGLGSGKWTSPKEADHLAARNHSLCLYVFKLEAAGLSRNAACEALASLHVDAAGEEVLSGSAIRKAVAETENLYAEEKRISYEAGESWSIDDKRQLLSPFDPEVLPKKIRRELGL
jgi:hypothetical protein